MPSPLGTYPLTVVPRIRIGVLDAPILRQLRQDPAETGVDSPQAQRVGPLGDYAALPSCMTTMRRPFPRPWQFSCRRRPRPKRRNRPGSSDAPSAPRSDTCARNRPRISEQSKLLIYGSKSCREFGLKRRPSSSQAQLTRDMIIV